MDLYINKIIFMDSKLFISIICIIIWSVGGTAVAQDRIITKEGETMDVYNVEISDKYIFYNKDKSKDSAFERMAKESVLMIKRQDGSTVNLYETAKAEEAPAAKPATEEVPAQEAVILTPELLDEVTREANAVSIAQANLAVAFVPDEADDLEKDANYIWYRMGMSENSVLDDGVVSLKVVSGYFGWESGWGKKTFSFKEGIDYLINPGMQVCVTNKSDRTIYIDLGNSFFTRMGQSQCYYVPSVTSMTSTTGSGASVNLGAVTSALGIGGVAGTLANGVNVGSGGSNGSTTVTYAQRIITVPPRSMVKLDAQFVFGTQEAVIVPGLSYNLVPGYKDIYNPVFYFPKDAPEGPLMTGQHFTYSEETSTVTVSVLVAYSFSEDGSASRTLSAHLYLKDVIGCNRNKFNLKNRGRIVYETGTIGFNANIKDRKGENSFPRQ